jgi:hypothetical protein
MANPLPDFVDALRETGAEVVEVPVYRWVLPEDVAPVCRLDQVVAPPGRRSGLHKRSCSREPVAAGRREWVARRGVAPGVVVSRPELLRALPGSGRDPHAVEMAVNRIRAVLGVKVVQTVVKRGYRLAYEPDSRGSDCHDEEAL